jgi:hypothetical protein
VAEVFDPWVPIQRSNVNQRTGAEAKTAENTLTMYDAKGNVIWQAPP